MSSQLIPSDNSLYNDITYWDKRYESSGQSSNQCYDWLVSYEDIKDIITKLIPKSASILMLGCGNSLLSEQMFIDGYHTIHNIDYSSPVIKQMAKHCDSCSQMDWSVMNCLDLQFNDQCFDVVIEKATIDALLTEEKNPWNISKESRDQLTVVFKEVYRVLKPEGQFISITFSAPHFRYPLFKSCLKSDTKLILKFIHEFESNFHYYCYEFIKSLENKTIEFKPNVYEPPKMTSTVNSIVSNETMDGNGAHDRDNDIFHINV